MNYSVRPITEQEYPRAMELWEECFPEDAGAFCSYYFSRRTTPKNIIAAFDAQNNMLGDLHMLHRTMSVNGENKEVLFIAGVGTAVKHRGKGIAGALLFAAADEAQKRGCCALLLQPFETGFYMQYGYVPFANLSYYNIERAQKDAIHFPTGKKTAPNEKTMLAQYAGFTSRYQGYFTRTKEDFALLKKEAEEAGGILTAFENGYAFGYQSSDTLELQELIGEPLPIVKTLLEEYESVSFPLPQNIKLSGFSHETKPFNMIKIIDEKKLLFGTGIRSFEELTRAELYNIDKY